MLLFEKELNLTVEEEAQTVTVLYWFTPEKRFLCERGSLMSRAVTLDMFEKITSDFSSTRIKPVVAEFESDDLIIVRGTRGTSRFSKAQIEIKERARKESGKEDNEFRSLKSVYLAESTG